MKELADTHIYIYMRINKNKNKKTIALLVTCAVLAVFLSVSGLAVTISHIEEHVLKLNLYMHLERLLMLTCDRNCQVDFQQVEIIHWLCETPSRQFVNNFTYFVGFIHRLAVSSPSSAWDQGTSAYISKLRIDLMFRMFMKPWSFRYLRHLRLPAPTSPSRLKSEPMPVFRGFGLSSRRKNLFCMQAPDFIQRQPLKITLVILFAAEATCPALHIIRFPCVEWNCWSENARVSIRLK